MDPTQAVALEARMQQLEAALAHHMQINNQLQAGLQQQPQVDMTALGTTTADEIARAMRSQSQPRTVVDIKGIGKPAPFKGDEVKFRMFAHKLAGFMSAVWPHARIVLRWAADQLETLNDDEAEQGWTRTGRTEFFRDVREFSAQLHASLIGLVEGEGFDLVTEVDGRCGWEAWRISRGGYDRQGAGRTKNMLKNVLNHPRCKASDMLSGMVH